jgi:hypothetical protein
MNPLWGVLLGHSIGRKETRPLLRFIPGFDSLVARRIGIDRSKSHGAMFGAHYSVTPRVSVPHSAEVSSKRGYSARKRSEAAHIAAQNGPFLSTGLVLAFISI